MLLDRTLLVGEPMGLLIAETEIMTQLMCNREPTEAFASSQTQVLLSLLQLPLVAEQ